MMPQLCRVLWLPFMVLAVLSCTSPSREGLPPGSPFAPPSASTSKVLPQGVAIGNVTSRSALLWLRTDGPMRVQVEWASVAVWEAVSEKAGDLAHVARTPLFMTGPDADFTLTIPFKGLMPATVYRYHVLVGPKGGEEQLTEARVEGKGEFTTLPDAQTSVPVTFAWSGDLGGQSHCRRGAAGYPIFDVVWAQKLDFFLMLGDTIYSDNVCSSPPNEPGADFTASTLEEYRARHRYQRGADSLRRFLESAPVYVMWDDHEVRNNFSGPSETLMPVGRQAFREYWPIRTDQQDPHRLYRTVRFGTDLELFILDARQYRSRNADADGPDKTMLGATQLRWLLDGIRTSTATWKLIATPVPLSIPKGGGEAAPGYDGWAGGPDGTGFERERQVIVDAIIGRKVKNVVFIAGDVHYVQANAYDPNNDGQPDFYEFVVGPLSASPGRLTPPSSALHPANMINEGGYFNFGVIRATRSSLEATVIDDAGRTRFTHRLTAQ